MLRPKPAPIGWETRAAGAIERVAGRVLEGHAAVFGVPARVGGFTETVRRGAFARSLASDERDVLALVDHDASRLLGRKSSGTLELREDEKGLAFRIHLAVPDSPEAREVLALAERRDLGGMSFGFLPVDEAWSPRRDARELRAVDLVEVSVVKSFPAYAGTTVAARGRTGEAVERVSLRARRRYAETI